MLACCFGFHLVDFVNLRYTNHSCVPNCVEEIGGGCVRFVALRDIEAGEEITWLVQHI